VQHNYSVYHDCGPRRHANNAHHVVLDVTMNKAGIVQLDAYKKGPPFWRDHTNKVRVDWDFSADFLSHQEPKRVACCCILRHLLRVDSGDVSAPQTLIGRLCKFEGSLVADARSIAHVKQVGSARFRPGQAPKMCWACSKIKGI